jgi:hypothetical protein
MASVVRLLFVVSTHLKDRVANVQKCTSNMFHTGTRPSAQMRWFAYSQIVHKHSTAQCNTSVTLNTLYHTVLAAVPPHICTNQRPPELDCLSGMNTESCAETDGHFLQALENIFCYHLHELLVIWEGFRYNSRRWSVAALFWLLSGASSVCFLVERTLCPFSIGTCLALSLIYMFLSFSTYFIPLTCVFGYDYLLFRLLSKERWPTRCPTRDLQSARAILANFTSFFTKQLAKNLRSGCNLAPDLGTRQCHRVSDCLRTWCLATSSYRWE